MLLNPMKLSSLSNTDQVALDYYEIHHIYVLRYGLDKLTKQHQRIYNRGEEIANSLFTNWYMNTRSSLHLNHQIYHLRHTQMDEQLALLLSPIISAYRPHTPIPTREELDNDRVAKSYVSM